ncbi:MAG TPA: hypothetical protein VNX60_05125 [Candidatus Acidoferrum sp.]|nr:hypothetical protein [Candidatus Acidoferrum sp.]
MIRVSQGGRLRVIPRHDGFAATSVDEVPGGLLVGVLPDATSMIMIMITHRPLCVAIVQLAEGVVNAPSAGRDLTPPAVIGWSLLSGADRSGLSGEYRATTILPFHPSIFSRARCLLRARIR